MTQKQITLAQSGPKIQPMAGQEQTEKRFNDEHASNLPKHDSLTPQIAESEQDD
jgi:hypothetical protein